jgi:uncharacterized membrane protein YvbJ
MYCSNCGKEIEDTARVCMYCGVPSNQGKQTQLSGEDTQTGCLIGGLCFFFPIVGLILYFVWKETKPESSKFAGKWALIGFIVNVVVSIFGGIVGGIIGGMGGGFY